METDGVGLASLRDVFVPSVPVSVISAAVLGWSAGGGVVTRRVGGVTDTGVKKGGNFDGLLVGDEVGVVRC
jgi:F0F1-type ATP synthase assembly protein I